MRMLRWMCGRSKKDRIRTECTWEHLRLASIIDKLRDSFKMVWTYPM